MIGRSRALDYIKHRKIINFMELKEAQNLTDDGRILEEKILADERKRIIMSAIIYGGGVSPQ